MGKEIIYYNKIREYCRQKDLFARGDRVVVGLSGGADSVCLFLVLLMLAKEWELTLFPVHVNHNLRGAEAVRDLEFCKELCRQHNLELQVISAQVAELAREQGLSLEEAGRNVRYKAFAEEKQKRGCHKIAVAHHKDDQAETVLFQMFRGSRLKGLSGMEAKNGDLVRPLLCVTREEIENYLAEKKQSFCIDSTNLEEEYTRNKIRHRILPTAKEVCSGAVEHITELAEYTGRLEELLTRLTEELYAECATVDDKGIIWLKTEPLLCAERLLAERVVYRVLCEAYGRKKDITSGFVADCMELLNKQSGRYLMLPEGMTVRKSFDRLCIGKEEEKNETYSVEITKLPCRLHLPQIEKNLTLFIKKREELPENIPKSTYTKWFDYDKISRVISVRLPEAEDEMIVYTDGRKKALSDVFAGAKVPKELRSGYPVLVQENQVLWVPCIRGSEGYRITKDTKQVLIATIDGGNEDGRQN